LHFAALGFLIDEFLELDHLQGAHAHRGFHGGRDFPSVLAGVWEHGEHFALQVGIGQSGAIYARDNLCGRLLLRGALRGCYLDGKRRRRSLLGLRGKNRKYEEDGD
jgi:hypothetical protein